MGAKKSLVDSFDFLLFGQGTKFPFRGYVSSIDPTTAGIGVLIGGSQNTHKTLLGTIKVRDGLKRRGTANSASAGVTSSYEWYTSLGVVFPLRVTEENKLQVESDIADGETLVWYDLMTGLDSTRFVFDTWWDDTLKKDTLLFVKFDANIYAWQGGIAKLVSASNAVGVITQIQTTPNAPSSGQYFTSGGVNYLPGDILTVTGGNGDARVTVNAIATGGVGSATLDGGGAGYVVGDLVQITGGISGTYKAVLRVATTGGGGSVATFDLITAGVGYATGMSLATTALTGIGVGFTVNITTVGNTVTAWTLTTAGTGYTGGSTRVATTGGSGTAATIYILETAGGSIVLDRDAAEAGFSPTGSVRIGANTYAYTGVLGTSLTGISPDASGEVAGSIVLSAVITNSPALLADFSCDFIKNVNNQLNVGSYNSRLIYVSAFDSYTNYTVPGVRVPGDPDLLTLDSQARGINVQKGSNQIGQAVISGGLGDWYSIVRAQETIGSDITENVAVIKTQNSDLATALSHEFIDVVGNDIIFLDQNNQLREFGTVRNIVNPVYPLLSLDVFTELQGRDFSGGHVRAVSQQHDTTVHITSPLDGLDYMYQIRQKIDEVGNLTTERIWDPPQVRGVSRIAVISGETYGHSNSNPQIYQVWNTGQYSDDSPSDEPISYECHAIFAYLSLPQRAKQLFFSHLYYEGYMSRGTNLYNNVYYEYQGSRTILQITVNKPELPSKKLAAFYSADGKTPSLGDVSLGLVPLGMGAASTGGDNPPKFRAIRQASATLSVFEYALDLFSVDLDSQWEILCLGTNMEPSPGQPGNDVMGITSR